MRREVVSLVCVLVASCVWLTHGATDPVDVASLNAMFTDFGSNPTLTKWVPSGGDPCGELWLGITCASTFVTAIELPNLMLTGKVDKSVLQQFQHVTRLDLSNNKFDSDIPEHFPPNLVELDLSNSKFSGNFPDQLMNVTSLASIKLSNNDLDETLNALTFTTLVNVVTLDLSDNEFSGTIPASIGDNMTSLEVLYLQNNKLSGDLPASLSNLAALQVFDVSDNKITGYLPPNFNPPIFSYQDNKIVQQAPPPPPFTAPPPLKNPTPGTTPPGQTTPSGQNTTPVASASSSSSPIAGSKVAAIGVVVLVAIAAAALAMWFFSFRKRPGRGFDTGDSGDSGVPVDLEANHNHDGGFCIWCLPLFSPRKDDEKPPKVKAFSPDDEKPPKVKAFSPDTMEKGMGESKVKAQPPIKTLSFSGVHPKGDGDGVLTEKAATEKVELSDIPATAFTVAELQLATNSFSQKTNLVGEGSLGRVYRGEFPDGRVLAVKKLDTKASMESENEFLSVVKRLAKLQHPNVNQLVGYCVDYEQRLLVYQYFNRGSLHELLHGTNQSLLWSVRVKIAVGAARALEYLHDVCSPPVVHGSFKSGNIMLDDELNPHVTDGGLEALAPSSAPECQVFGAQKLGASGYSAPECAMSWAYTAKSDVYSFGVVMLELMTGRKPLDSSRPRSEHSLVRWATPQLHDIGALERMMDPALKGIYPAKSLSRLADIVALCVQPEPEFRPPMSEVVQSLVWLMQHATLGNRQTESKSASLQTEDPNEQL